MKVKIGVADANRIVEVESDEPEELKASIEAAFAADRTILWFEDTKKRLVGIPRDKIAFIEIDQDAAGRTVGFARASG
ncbi:MAG: DUF3107 domain-containing protein [Actinomycetota bacterium]